MRYALAILMTAIFLQSCSYKPTRHLASEATLIKPGLSTVDDVRSCLGEPEDKRIIAPGVVEYIYYEDRPSSFASAPIFGSWLDNKGSEMIIVTLRDSLVTGCEFRTFYEDDQEWVDDYTWEDIK
ncbi:MAG: hypothetical protein CSA32_00365 [Desulfobulbus propionicus]|nr:MAG: hypothetical protein CSA32_00365 [Desulfobulbus propionicus]